MQNQIESQGSQTAKFAHLSNNLNETMMCCYPNLIRLVQTPKKPNVWKDITTVSRTVGEIRKKWKDLLSKANKNASSQMTTVISYLGPIFEVQHRGH